MTLNRRSSFLGVQRFLARGAELASPNRYGVLMVFLATACSDWPRQRRNWPLKIRCALKNMNPLIACKSSVASCKKKQKAGFGVAGRSKRTWLHCVPPEVASLPRTFLRASLPAQQHHFLAPASLTSCQRQPYVPAQSSPAFRSRFGGRWTVDGQRGCHQRKTVLSPRSGTGLAEGETGRTKCDWPAPADWLLHFSSRVSAANSL